MNTVDAAPDPAAERISQHYGLPGLLARIDAGLGQLGVAPEALTLDHLAPVDEFHFRGPAATAELIALLDPQAGTHILDVGSGLGGPARRLAKATGCRVTGVDLSAEYCTVGNSLNQRLGLDSLVGLQTGDATDLSGFADATFDGAWTIHVGMNIADKQSFYTNVVRVLKPGARFVLFDVLNADNGEVHYPMPWAATPETSFLVTAEQLNAALRSAGLDVVEVRDDTEAGRAFVE